jgi:uncharacterized phage protein (TIGR01671 family)
MREFKFRAWCALLQTHKMRLFDLDDIQMGAFALHPSDTVMQFTGLHDKNEKDIYEGDIVKLRCGGEDGATARNKIIATVEWHYDRFRAIIPDKTVIVRGGSMAGKKMSWREIHTWCGMHTCLTHGWGYVEVIGNIYENPELLTRKESSKSPDER